MATQRPDAAILFAERAPGHMQNGSSKKSLTVPAHGSCASPQLGDRPQLWRLPQRVETSQLGDLQDATNMSVSGAVTGSK